MKGICPNCEKETELELVRTREVVEVRGEPIEVDTEFFRCTECGVEFENTRGAGFHCACVPGVPASPRNAPARANS